MIRHFEVLTSQILNCFGRCVMTCVSLFPTNRCVPFRSDELTVLRFFSGTMPINTKKIVSIWFLYEPVFGSHPFIRGFITWVAFDAPHQANVLFFHYYRYYFKVKTIRCIAYFKNGLLLFCCLDFSLLE